MLTTVCVTIEQTAGLLRSVAEHLEKNVSDSKFDIREYYDACGSPSCVIGWGASLPDWQESGVFDDWHVAKDVGQRMGLNGQDIQYLFYADANGWYISRQAQSRLEVVRRLREVADKLVRSN